MNYASFLTQDNLAIFLLHGVIDKNLWELRNYKRKHIEKEYFIHFLKNIKSNGNPMSMEEVLYSISNKIKFPHNSFAITFDDGFENNYSIAAPILDEFNIPATFYITTDFIDQNSMSWIDKIEFAFETTLKNRIKFEWKFSDTIFNSLKDKMLVLDEIRAEIKSNPNVDVDLFVQNVFDMLEVPLIHKSNDVLDKKMNWKQLNEIKNHNNFIIGGHSHTHKILAFLSDEQLNMEINTSLSMLNNNLDIDCIHYSYPEGMANCYNLDVINLLQNKGIKLCPTAEDGINSLSVDPFHLKRINIV